MGIKQNTAYPAQKNQAAGVIGFQRMPGLYVISVCPRIAAISVIVRQAAMTIP